MWKKRSSGPDMLSPLRTLPGVSPARFFPMKVNFKFLFWSRFSFSGKQAVKAIKADMGMRQMAPAYGLSVAIRRFAGGGTCPVSMVTPRAQSPGVTALPTPHPEAERDGVTGGANTPLLCQEAWEAKACSLRGKISQETWPIWEQRLKLMSDLEKQVQEEPPRGRAEGTERGKGRGRCGLGHSHPKGQGACLRAMGPLRQAQWVQSTPPSLENEPLNSCSVHSFLLFFF